MHCSFAHACAIIYRPVDIVRCTHALTHSRTHTSPHITSQPASASATGVGMPDGNSLEIIMDVNLDALRTQTVNKSMPRVEYRQNEYNIVITCWDHVFGIFLIEIMDGFMGN